MKVIDLLNKINNNEEIPEKIKFDDTIFKYDKRQKNIITKKIMDIMKLYYIEL